MKNSLFAALAALTILAAPAFADPAPRILTLTGQGEAKAVPDIVTLSAGVTVEAINAAAALSADTVRMQAVMAALRKQNIADRNIQTSQFAVSPQYANAEGQSPRLTGYQVTNQLSVRVDDAARLGAVLDALVSAGANRVNGIDFAIADPSAPLAEARQKAVTDALLKAQTYAKAAGVTLGPILSISENDNAGPRPVFMAVRAAKAVPVALGEESVTANVSIVWQIQ